MRLFELVLKGRRAASAVVAAALVVQAAAAGTAQVVSASGLTPTPHSTLPSPFTSGHAGLYGWGAATMPDGSVLIGDYWNHRVVHYSTAGVFLGVLFNMPAKPLVYTTPYGLAVDPATLAVYVGFQCCAVEKFVPGSKGNYFLASKKLVAPGMSYPSRVAVGADGTVYVSDMVANTIFRFDAGANYLGSWFSTGSGTGQLNQPRALALDSSTPQNLYVADASNHRVDVISTGGITAGQFVNTFGAGHLGLDTRGLAIDTVNGWVYVVDDSTNKVHQFHLDGTWNADLGGAWATDGRTCCAPDGLFANGGREATVDGLGHLWVGDMPDYRVQVFDAAGGFVMSEPNPAAPPPAGAFNGAQGVALDPAGDLIVADTYNFRVQKFSPSSVLLWAQGIRGTASQPYAQNYPIGLAVEPADSSIIVVDSFNNAVRKYDAGGNWIWTYNTTGGHGLNSPEGVALGAGGTIYVADTLKHRVAVLNDLGASVAWTKAIPCGCFKQPSGVAFDPITGNLFVSDFMAAAVQELSPTGALLRTIGGSTSSQPLQNPADVVLDGSYLYVSDNKANLVMVYSQSDGSPVLVFGGTGSGVAQFNQPFGLALDGAGHLIVADSGNDRISTWCLTTC